MILTLLLFIVILGSIVLVHESGHFIFAKLVGVHVYEFSIGMGPVIFKKIAKDKTQYSIRAVPIGGFVSLAGEETDLDLEKQKGHNLQDKTVFQRFFSNLPTWQTGQLMLYFVFYFVEQLLGSRNQYNLAIQSMLSL